VKNRLVTFTKSISGPELFLLLVLLIFGSMACLATPLSAGYDEETHIVRAWEMAHLYFVPNEQLGAKLPFPALYWELSYRRQPIVEAVQPGLWSKYGSLRLDAHDYVYANVETRSVYSPLLLLPQALTLRYLGLSLQLPALAVYYACRFAGLLSYLILCWLALRSLPYGKWLMAILMVSPMALFQASTINTDTISNGIGFLFLGVSLAFASKHEINWKSWWILLGLIALLFMAKVNLVFLVLLPFLLIRPSRFKMKYGYIVLAGAALALFLIEVGGWNVVAYSHFTRMLEGANPSQQVRYILSAPLQFIKIIANDVWTNTAAYMQGWVGVYGYNYFPVPALTYLLYPLAVIAALVAAAIRVHPQSAEVSSAPAPIQPEALPHPGQGIRAAPLSGQPRRIEQMQTPLVLILLFIIGYLLTIVSLYVAFTPVRSQFVAGVQGRYFTPVMPLLLLALVSIFARRGDPAGRPWFANIHIPSALPVILALSALVLYVAGLILSYNVPCGSEYYRFGLCYQPEYKNWAPESSSSRPISPALTLTQEIVPACDGMQQLLVWVNSPGTDASGTTQVTLRAPQEEKDLVRQTFQNADIPKDGWLILNFAPEWQSGHNLYLLTLSGSSADGIQVGYSAKSEYLKGKLTENGSPVEQDMLFQYGCVAGLQRWLQGK
jgi:uncharacterized membrane protein